MYCTDYDICLPDNLIPKSEKEPIDYDPYPNGPGVEPNLFMNVFPISSDPAIRDSLAFSGHGATVFPGFIQHELLAMSVSQIWRGTRTLPTLPEMQAWHSKNKVWRAQIGKKYNAAENGTYYTAMLPFSEFISWLDSTVGTGVFENLGGKLNGLFNWKCWKLWLEDRELYDLCTKGILSPTIWRIFEADRVGRPPLLRAR